MISETQRAEIDRALQNDLTSEDREVLDKARECLQKMSGGSHLDDWLLLGKAQNIRGRLAMRLARSNKRKGPLYSSYLHQLLESEGIDTKDKKLMGDLTAVSWLCDDQYPERLATLHD